MGIEVVPFAVTLVSNMNQLSVYFNFEMIKVV